MNEKLSQKERTRSRILDEAARVLHEGGSKSIGVAALMKRVGLTHGGFYAHFENRDDLIAHAVDRMRTDTADTMSKLLDGRPAAEGIPAMIDYCLSEDTVFLDDRGCPLPALAQEARRMPGAASYYVLEMLRNFRTRFTQAFDELGATDPSSLASSVLSEIVGAVTLARALGESDEATQILLACRSDLKRRVSRTMI